MIVWLSGHVSPEGLVRAFESGVEVGSGPVLVEEPLLPLPVLDDEPLPVLDDEPLPGKALTLDDVPLGAGVRVALAVVDEPDALVEPVVEVVDVPVVPGRGVGVAPPVGIIDGDEPEPVEMAGPLDGAVVRAGVVIGSRSQLNRSLFGRLWSPFGPFTQLVPPSVNAVKLSIFRQTSRPPEVRCSAFPFSSLKCSFSRHSPTLDGPTRLRRFSKPRTNRHDCASVGVEGQTSAAMIIRLANAALSFTLVILQAHCTSRVPKMPQNVPTSAISTPSSCEYRQASAWQRRLFRPNVGVLVAVGETVTVTVGMTVAVVVGVLLMSAACVPVGVAVAGVTFFSASSLRSPGFDPVDPVAIPGLPMPCVWLPYTPSVNIVQQDNERRPGHTPGPPLLAPVC